MPQLDIVPFSIIYIWVIISFFLFYFIFLKYMLPIISQWLKTYNKLQVFIIYSLFIYDRTFYIRDFLIQELLIKCANFILSLSLLSKNVTVVVPSFLMYNKVSIYEKSTIYLVKKCFKKNNT